jgi:hypothetical protein
MQHGYQKQETPQLTTALVALFWDIGTLTCPDRQGAVHWVSKRKSLQALFHLQALMSVW